MWSQQPQVSFTNQLTSDHSVRIFHISRTEAREKTHLVGANIIFFLRSDERDLGQAGHGYCHWIGVWPAHQYRSFLYETVEETSGAMLSRMMLPCLRCDAVRKSFHTTVPSKAVPPVLYLMIKPLTRLAAALIGKTARVAWRRLPAERKILIKQSALAHRKKFISSGVLFGGSLLYAYESHLQQCPVTGRTR